MPVQECLVFDVFGPYACYKTYFTTSSPLTFDFPPKTAIAGTIGAIIGLDLDAKYDLFKGVVGLKILSSGDKIYAGMNWLDTKARGSAKDFASVPSNVDVLETLSLPVTPQIGAFVGMIWPGKNPHTQVNIEILKNPRFRLYYPDTSPCYADLKQRVEAHQAVYTPFLGVANFIANFVLVDVASMTEITTSGQDFIPVSSVIPVPGGQPGPELDLSAVSTLMARVPMAMLPGREVTAYSTVIYTLKGAPIPAKVLSYCRVKGKTIDDNVIFF